MNIPTLAQVGEVVLLAVPVVIAITFHEAAHGFVARHFGDPTAADRGRLTLNPLKHIDPIGTIMLPALLLISHAGFLFGYAKPVPVDFSRLRNPKRDMIWVAAAGPATNFVLAAISFALLFAALHLGAPGWLGALFWSSIEINLVLGIFNLWPIPPLDGSKVAIGLLPLALARPLIQFDRYGMLVLVVIFIVLPMAGIDLFRWMVGYPVAWFERPILWLLGVQG